MLARGAALLLVALGVGCSALVSGDTEEMGLVSPEGSRGASASSSLVTIHTVTPVPAQAALAGATPGVIATSPANPTLSPTATGTSAAASLLGVTEVESTPDAPEDTATPDATGTPEESPTPSATQTPTPTPTETATPTPVTPTIVPLPGLTSEETQIFVDHNELRDDYGLRRFRLSDTLMDIARARAAAMASLGVMTHYNADGTTVFDMMAAEGYGYVTGAENIHFNWGYTDQQSVHVAVASWIESASHYANMVNPALGHIGIGLAKGSDGTVYYSVVFSD